MTRSPELGTAVRCPSTSLYWAVLDASMLPRRPGSPSGRQLGYLFEEVLPVPIESVHAVYLPLHGQHYLACGADEALVRAAHDNGALALVPTELPPFVVESAAVVLGLPELDDYLAQRGGAPGPLDETRRAALR